MTKKEFLKKTKTSESMIRIVNGTAALEAVKKYGDALRYVKEQTPEICIEAIEQDKSAIEYVDVTIFEKDGE